MKNVTWSMAVGMVMFLGGVAGARPPEDGGGRGGPPSPERMVEHAMRFDADGDGKLDRAELTKFAEEMQTLRMRSGEGGPGVGQGRQGRGPVGGPGFGPGGQGRGPGGQGRGPGGQGRGPGADRGGPSGPGGESGDFERPRRPE